MTSHWNMTAGARRAVVFLFALSLLFAAVNLLWTSHEVGRVTQLERANAAAILSSCKFDADIGGAPVAPAPGMRAPARLGVEVVADARLTWRQLGCPGRLAPNPTLARWARYYHLPAS